MQGQDAPVTKSAPLPSDAAGPSQAALPSVKKKVKSLKQAAALYDAELPADLVQLEAGINGGSAAETSVAGAEGKAAAINKQKGHATRQQAAPKVKQPCHLSTALLVLQQPRLVNNALHPSVNIFSLCSD